MAGICVGFHIQLGLPAKAVDQVARAAAESVLVIERMAAYMREWVLIEALSGMKHAASSVSPQKRSTSQVARDAVVSILARAWWHIHE